MTDYQCPTCGKTWHTDNNQEHPPSITIPCPTCLLHKQQHDARIALVPHTIGVTA